MTPPTPPPLLRDPLPGDLPQYRNPGDGYRGPAGNYPDRRPPAAILALCLVPAVAVALLVLAILALHPPMDPAGASANRIADMEGFELELTSTNHIHETESESEGERGQ